MRSLLRTSKQLSISRAPQQRCDEATSCWSAPASTPAPAVTGGGHMPGGPAPGLSFTTAPWLFDREIAAIATDTWGFEVRPNEFDDAFQPLHQVVIPHMGMYLGEMWRLDELAEQCVAEGRYEFLLSAPPLPITGAVGSPLNPVAIL